MSTPQDAGAEFDRYAETGAIQPDPPAAAPENNAAAYPDLVLTTIPPRIETITAPDGEIYELRLRHHYSLGIQSGLINAYNTILGYMDRERDEFVWIDDALDDPAMSLNPPPDGAGDAETPSGDGITTPLAIVPPVPAPRTGPLDQREQQQRRFLLDKIAQYAIPDAPAPIRKAMTIEQLETLCIRFFVRSQAAQQEAEQMGGPPTSGGSSPASNGSTGATPTPGSGNSTPASSTPSPTNIRRSARRKGSGS